jgi:Mg2+/Co2+ transporter CorC
MIATIVCLFAIGLIVRYWCERSEAYHLHLSVSVLYPDDRDDTEVEPDLASTVLRRTRMALSAVKLMRLVSLFLLVPTTSLLAVLAIEFVNEQWLVAPVRIIAGFVLLFGILFLLHASAALVVPVPKSSKRSKTPEWVIREEVLPPAAISAGWYAWETLIAGVDRLMTTISLGRPRAKLIEQDQEVRLSVDSFRLPHEPRPKKGTSEVLQVGDDRTTRQMVKAIEGLDKTLVREVMRPINKVTAIRLPSYTPKRLLALCRRTGYTRIPVYEDTVTNLIGYINVYDLLEQEKLPESLRPLVIRPLFVPEVARVDSTLQEMILRKQQVAIVFDEYGGTSGWISREDILEEIVGEVGDEYEHPKSMVERVGDAYVVDASMNLDDVRNEVGLDLPRRNYDSIAGWIYARLGRAPRRGETLEEAGWKIVVANVVGHRISNVRLLPPTEVDRQDESGA